MPCFFSGEMMGSAIYLYKYCQRSNLKTQAAVVQHMRTAQVCETDALLVTRQLDGVSLG